ncbi:MAG TPA: BON domain-containing protein [Steroidobacteraceae bacterium]|nr:BON domain-containing protein [Steroidobacteraceae bacterium]
MSGKGPSPGGGNSGAIWVAAIFMLSSICATRIGAQEAGASSGNDLQQITVTAKKTFLDEQVAQNVETALHDDPYIFDTHVTITTKNGVVTLHGFVFDYEDVLAMRRLAKKVPGVKKVVNDIEVKGGAAED